MIANDIRREPVDVCILVEGCYPFVAGGVASWLDWLMRKQPDLTFGVVAIMANDRPRQSKYPAPQNLRYVEVLPLARKIGQAGLRQPVLDVDTLAINFRKMLVDGDLAAFGEVMRIVTAPVRRAPMEWASLPRRMTYDELMGSRVLWDVMMRCYTEICPNASEADFFWAWRNLIGGLFSLVVAPLPQAGIYHTISTGYAGLLAARASVEMGKPTILTEHGIYSNERRIDLIMADWILDTIQVGLTGRDDRKDIRSFWIDTFESYARVCYASSTRVTTLYGENQFIQRALGAQPERLRVIPNGIELEKFEALPKTPPPHPPTAALIGRVVPIKDIEAFIEAAALVHEAIPEAEILIIGPTDEDEEYYELCQRRVAEAGLDNTVTFTGKLNIFDILPRIDVLVLTSISEAQPLVILEAGAAHIPCVATDVGSCREIIEGGPDEIPNLGSGGRVVPPMDSKAIGAAIVELLHAPDLRRDCGNALRKRVELYYTSQLSADRYRALYRELGK
jgi:glycosyltransferase involved in cell wall biosynthesis